MKFVTTKPRPQARVYEMTRTTNAGWPRQRHRACRGREEAADKSGKHPASTTAANYMPGGACCCFCSRSRPYLAFACRVLSPVRCGWPSPWDIAARLLACACVSIRPHVETKAPLGPRPKPGVHVRVGRADVPNWPRTPPAVYTASQSLVPCPWFVPWYRYSVSTRVCVNLASC